MLISSAGPGFTVSQVNSTSDKEEIVSVLEGWKKLICEKIEKIDSSEAFAFHDVKDIIDWMLPSFRLSEGRSSVGLVCRDWTSKIQAVATHSKMTNYIHFIVTHPDNIRHPINMTIESRVSGSGSAIIFYLAKMTLDSKMPLSLCPTKSAINFYKKLGFLSDSAELHFWLSAKKIMELIVSGTSPFVDLI